MRQLASYIFGCTFAALVGLAVAAAFTHAVAHVVAYFPGR